MIQCVNVSFRSHAAIAKAKAACDRNNIHTVPANFSTI
jgi:hypothetical protein